MYCERPLLGICSDRSRVEKRPSRFSFIRAEAFIPHPFGCNKRYESRVQFLMRTHSATFTARCVIGDAKKSCAGNFALTRSLQVARGTSHDARQGCRVALSHNICAFCAAKCGSERYKDVTRTDTARNYFLKSGGEKRPSRFSFINTLAISARGTSRFALVASSALLEIA